jgi:hypothetical protein
MDDSRRDALLKTYADYDGVKSLINALSTTMDLDCKTPAVIVSGQALRKLRKMKIIELAPGEEKIEILDALDRLSPKADLLTNKQQEMLNTVCQITSKAILKEYIPRFGGSGTRH